MKTKNELAASSGRMARLVSGSLNHQTTMKPRIWNLTEIPENFDAAADSGLLQPRLVGLLCFAGDLEVNGEEINGCALEIERSALSARPLPMYRQCAILPIGELRKMEAVVEAANCIRHWHDREGGGMVVSAEHVRKLWAALYDLEANA